MTPAVSVLMPVLNPHPVYFPEAVASVLAQTLPDWELVIVEDPSPACAADLLSKFDDPRIRHTRNAERTNLITQLNQGLAACRADLVARFDADDIAHPTRLARQAEFLRANPDIDVVGSAIDIIDEAGQPHGARPYPLTHDDIVRTLRRYNALAHPSVTFRREAALRAGGYQLLGPAEDYDLWSRLARAGSRFANLPDALIRYRVHPSASKGTKLRAMIRSTLDVKRAHWWGDMSAGDRLRFRAEQALLWVPPGVVTWLFKRLTYS